VPTQSRNAGSSQVAAHQPGPGSATAAISTIPTERPTTAAARHRTSEGPAVGVVEVISCIASAGGPYAVATASTGSTGAKTSNSS